VTTGRATRVLAPNPGPMTLEGTNTWVIGEPGADGAVVVDPGPADEGHLRQVAALATEGGRRVRQILLTHGHPDHCDGAGRLAELTGAPIRAADPAHRLSLPGRKDALRSLPGRKDALRSLPGRKDALRSLPGRKDALRRGEGLGPGDVVTGAGCDIEVVATPGHSADSVSFLIPADGVLLTGDTVLGRGTTVIADDGRLSDYLDSLDRLRALADSAGLTALLPGHGPVVPDPIGTLDYYIAHRKQRLAEVIEALNAGDRTPDQIVARVYADVDRALWPFAQWSVRAALGYLAERGELPADESP
jgi:glyoxylase-like metal-dependent hydrolase (beta-lactamase superfamily II)